MYTVKTTYEPHELKMNMKYICSCGYKMTRVNSDYYTMSPFNPHTEEACEANLKYSVFTQVRTCPKCGTSISPVLNDEQKSRVAEWKKIYEEDCDRLKKVL